MANFSYAFQALKAAYKQSRKAAATRLHDLAKTISPWNTIKSEPAPGQTFTLASFEEFCDIIPWNVESDRARGGDSNCEAAFAESSLVLKGQLVHLKSSEFHEILYAEATLPNIVKKKLVGYNGVRIQVKTDGKQYHFALGTASAAQEAKYFAYIEDSSKDWVTLELPFSAFQHANDSYDTVGGLDDPQEFVLTDIVFGISSCDRTKFNFEAALRRVEVIYRPDFRFISRFTLPRPVMVKPVPDYAKAKTLDTGSMLLK